MSNAMSVSKSLWKGALLAGVATAVISPVLANAAIGTESISLSLSPLGGTGFKTTEYVAPGGTLPASVPIYVYATITGSTAVSSSEIDGIKYAYYNIAQSITSSNGSIGSITAVANNTATGFNFNGNGSQIGAFNVSSTLALGSTSDITQIAKPQTGSVGVFSSNTADTTNEIISGNSVSFLLQKLTYTPTFAAKSAVAGTADKTALSISVPSSTLLGSTGTIYPLTNYFTDLSSTPTTSPGNSSTGLTYTPSATAVTLIDAEKGDANLDGTVNGTDLSIIATHLNTATTGYSNGDLNGDGIVNGTDLSLVATNLNIQYSTVAPAAIAAPTAEILSPAAVPEPATLSLIALVGGGLLSRRRHR